ncbi:MAG: hypothetical protein WD397_17320 [Wenzhouxiangellaceae bacterium]
MTIHQERIEQRLRELTTEIAKGNRQLETLEQRRIEIEQTLLRLSGAVQVLSELLDAGHSPHHSSPADSARADSSGPSALAAGG